jgi:hypothetical protein
MSEKDLLYQIISRRVDGFLAYSSPALRLFSSTITNYIINFIDPYVDAFFLGGTKLDTEMASAYIKEELGNKLDSFIKEFEIKRKNGM